MSSSAIRQLSANRIESVFRTERAQPGAKLRLYCLHHAGGSSALFHGWGKVMPPSIEAKYVVFPGREARFAEPAASSVEALVEQLAPQLELDIDRPFAMLGHSFGGLVAFELAHALRNRGLPEPVHLFVSAARAPHVWPGWSRLDRMPFEQLLDELRRFGGTPKAVLDDHELMREFVPMIRADFRAVATYRYTPRRALSCPITALQGSDDVIVPSEAIAAWETHTGGPFELHEFSGEHFFIKASMDRVVDTITRSLNRA